MPPRLMTIHSLSARMAVAALAFGLLACASQPPPRSQTRYTPQAAKPQPSGYVSVRYVQPTTPAAASDDAAERTRHQAHMRRALAYLQAARTNLNAATSTRSGHRQGAIQYTDQAIGHVEAGIAHADSR